VDGGVLAGRFLVKKQFFARGGFGRDFGGTRFKVHRWFFWIFGRKSEGAIDQWVDLVN
jgi:hypothetical protein